MGWWVTLCLSVVTKMQAMLQTVSKGTLLSIGREPEDMCPLLVLTVLPLSACPLHLWGIPYTLSWRPGTPWSSVTRNPTSRSAKHRYCLSRCCWWPSPP